MKKFSANTSAIVLRMGMSIALVCGIAACSQEASLPASTGNLRSRAKTLEAQSDIVGAAQAIAQALASVPGDPELLQQAAEYALCQKDWMHAQAFAQQSYDRGPKLGALCRRNWTTLRFVRLVHGDANGVQAAMQQVATCTVAAPVRM